MRHYFANPWFLCLLPLVPFIVWRWLQRPRPALRYSDTALLATLPAGRSSWAQRLGIALRALALLFLVLAMTGPRWPDHSTRIPTEGIAIMMVVDVSGSMGEEDFEWVAGERVTRLEAVKRAFRLFVAGGDGPDGQHFDGRQNDLIGIVPFAALPTGDDCPLTLSHSVLLHLIDKIRPEKVPVDAQTNLSDAIILGLSRLQGEEHPRKVLVLLTDGEHNVEKTASDAKPRQAAQLAANLNIPIYTIDAGPPPPPGAEGSGNEDAEKRLAGARALQNLSHITNGQYFPATDAKTLLEVYRKIDGLERQDIESYQYRRYYEAFAWFGLAALVLWLTVTCLELTSWQRLP